MDLKRARGRAAGYEWGDCMRLWLSPSGLLLQLRKVNETEMSVGSGVRTRAKVTSHHTQARVEKFHTAHGNITFLSCIGRPFRMKTRSQSRLNTVYILIPHICGASQPATFSQKLRRSTSARKTWDRYTRIIPGTGLWNYDQNRASLGLTWPLLRRL
jgi:hypothetical protein